MMVGVLRTARKRNHCVAHSLGWLGVGGLHREDENIIAEEGRPLVRHSFGRLCWPIDLHGREDPVNRENGPKLIQKTATLGDMGLLLESGFNLLAESSTASSILFSKIPSKSIKRLHFVKTEPPASSSEPPFPQQR